MVYKNLFRLSLLAGVASIATIPAAALAQEAGGDEIVVTSVKQQYRGDVPLQDLPQAVTVLSGELLETANITRLDMALELSGGIAKQNNFGGLWDAFAVRGFAGDENVPSGFLVNGFNSGRGFGGPRDASNIESIEIMKGPSSALFGRGEPGGTVNIITKKPQFEPSGSLSASYGSFQTYRVDGDVTGPVNDRIAVRVNGAYEEGESFRDTIEMSKHVITPSVFIQLTDDTSLSYELEYVHQEVPFDRGVVAINGQLGVIPASRFLGEPGDGPIEVDVLGHQAQLQHDFNSDWSVLFGVGYRDTSLQGFSSDAELVGGRQSLFVDGRSLSRQRRYRDFDTQYLVIRGEISGEFETGGLGHHVLLGADWDNFESDQIQLRFRPAPLASSPTPAQGNVIDIFTPVYGSLPTPGQFIDRLEEQDAWGIYFQDQVELTDRLQVRFGGRYDDFSQTLTNQLTSGVTEQSGTKFSPQAGVVFEASETVSLYASYGAGFRTNTGSDFNGDPFAPEETDAYEVGAKFVSADGKLNATVSIFQMDKTNIMTADPVHAGFSLAVGEARSRGVEFDFNGELPGEIKLWLSYAYLDVEVTKDVLDFNFGQLIEKGDSLINVPKHNFSALAFKDFMVGDRALTIGGGVSHVGERLGETATDFYLPEYSLVKLIAAIDVIDGLKLSGEVNNLFDVTYYPNSYAQLWVAPGAPRRFNVKLSYSF